MRSMSAMPSLVVVPRTAHAAHCGLRSVLGDAAWGRLPAAVRQRFGEGVVAIDYVGTFEVVHASWLGRIVAHLCRLLGTPIVPRTGSNVPAIVHVGPHGAGVAWNREYRWPGGKRWLICSTKVIDPQGQLVERLPARLCMSLAVHEREGVLHFISRGYYFDLRWGDLRWGDLRWGDRGSADRGWGWKLPLPAWLSPGVTHVEHRDESAGWFRFTLHVDHSWFGQLFYQTGRFRAAEEST